MLERIYDAANRIKDEVHKTPVLTSSQLDVRCNARVYLKCENFQRGGAFKFRGAYNTISQLPNDQKELGIITHSSGNHAQAVALSAQLLGIDAVIVMPSNAPQVKVDATRGYGAEIIFCEPTQDSRISTVEKEIDEYGYTLVHPYDNDNIIAGAGTAAKELLDEVPELDVIIAPTGGGGLLSGTAIFAKSANHDLLVYGAEPFGADDAYQSFTSGKRVIEQTPKTIADGLRTTLSERTFEYITTYVDDIIRVRDQDTIDTLRFIMERMKIVIEPSSAVPIAGVMKDNRFRGKKVGIIVSGGNFDMSVLFNHLDPVDKTI